MAVRLFHRMAARSAPAVFVCIGPRMQALVEGLFARAQSRRMESPAGAAILLVAGDIPRRAAVALDRIHDQIPPPRETVHWDGCDDPMTELLAAWARLMAGESGEPDRLPDDPPNPWKGHGDHGQGGEGMMGGVPYGRPMAMTGEDPRDGLKLDAYTMRVGPFAPMLPPGLVLELTLQGDLIASARVTEAPFPQPEDANAPRACAARLLRLLGLGPQADRLLRGTAPRSLNAVRALPVGLGAAGTGGDARTRLRGWLEGKPAEGPPPDIPRLLEGREWHEAVVLLNSWPPDTIRQAAEAAR